MIYVGILANAVWPLVVVLLGLFILRAVSTDVRPVFVSIVGGVAKQAGSNATAYAIAIMFGLSASLSAFVDVFKDMDKTEMDVITFPQVLALIARVANPFIVAVLAYATQNKFSPKLSGSTTPPFPDKPPVT